METDPFHLRKITNEIYTHLQSKITNGKGDADKLKDMRSISISDSIFVHPQNVSLSELDNFPPFRYTAPRELNVQFGSLLKNLGVVDQFVAEDYCNILSECKEKHQDRSLSKDMLDLVRNVAKRLSEVLTGETPATDVYLPDESKKRMKRSSDLCFNDCPWIDDKTLPFVDSGISYPVAHALGVITKRTKTLQNASKGLPFGQKELLTNRIKRILSGYPNDEDILKELLQNADDAQATEIVFCLDTRRHRKEKIFEDCWEPLQGPALCVYNNKPFSQADVIGIQNLGGGSKGEDATKTGQYGVGFNAVYHITDTPSFLTNVSGLGERLYLFDPNCLYVPSATKSEPGREFEDLTKLRRTFPCVFGCYDIVLKNVIKSDKGTLFRFPLRTKKMADKSGIKTKATSVERIRQMLETFKHDASHCLLFLNSIKRIRLYEMDSNNKASLIYSIDATLDKDSRGKLLAFQKTTKLLSRGINRDRKHILNVPKEQVAYEMTMNDSTHLNQRWLIVQQFGVNQALSQETIHAALGRDFHLLPRGGVACELNSPNRTRNKVFCTLPLPQTTSLQVHINGHFALDHEARRRVWMSGKEDEKTQWNKLLMRLVIAHAYVRLVVEMRDRMFKRTEQVPDILTDLGYYQQLFPKTQANCSFSHIVRSFYSVIGKEEIPVLPVFRMSSFQSGGEAVTWFSALDKGVKGLVFDARQTKFSRFDKGDKNTCLRDLLLRCGLNILWREMSALQREFTESDVETRQPTPKTVLQYFKSLTPTDMTHLHVGVNEVADILLFCKEDSEFVSLLDGTPLLFTESKTFRIFDSSDPSFLTRHTSVIPHEYHDQFVHHRLVRDVFDSCKSAEVFKELTVQSLSIMLPKELRLRSHEILRDFEKVSDNWINDLWTLLHEIVHDKTGATWSETLEPLKKFCLVPAYRKTNASKVNILVEVSRSKSVVLSDDDPTKQRVIECLQTLGVPFLSENLSVRSRRKGKKKTMQGKAPISELMETSNRDEHNSCMISKLNNPSDILISVEMRNECEPIKGMLSQEQCNYMLNYFCVIDDSNSLQRVKQLPLFCSVVGTCVSLDQKKSFIVPDDTPTTDLGLWEGDNKVVFLKDQPGFDSSWREVLNVSTIDPVEFYCTYILQRFTQMTDQGRLDHLTHIRDTVLPKLNIPNRHSNLVSVLKVTTFLPSVTGVLCCAYDFYDWKMPVFSAMLDDGKFPPQPYRTKQWHQFLKELGLKQDVTVNHVEQFANQVANFDFKTGKKKAEAILKFLAENFYLNNRMLLKRKLEKIQWIPVKRRPRAYPSDLKWAGDDILFEKPIATHSPDPSSSFLVGCLKPVADVNLCTGLEYAKVDSMDVVSNLILVSESTKRKSKNEFEKFRTLVLAIYDHLQNVISTDIIEKLKSKKCIFISEVFVFLQPSHVSFSKEDNFPPFRHSLPVDLNGYSNLLKSLGVADEFDNDDYRAVLNELKEIKQGASLSDEELGVSIRAASRLTDSLEGRELTSDVYLPTNSTLTLELSTELCFDDCPWIADDNMYFVHKKIPLSVAHSLGVRTKRRKVLERSSFGIPFGQSEKLTNRLRRILSGYPDYNDILKEMLQNADDAGATEVIFCLDTREHSTDKIFDDNWKPLQGPALCVYNNRPFTKDDVAGIQNLGEGSKGYDPMKTGQYGVGFNSVYQITDAPSFLTSVSGRSERLYVLDPNCEFVPSATVYEPGRCFEDLHELRKTFPSVFECYDSVLKHFKGTSHEGTLFRLPLRTKRMAGKSKIKQEPTTVAELQRLMEKLKVDAKECLLFLNNVQKITICCIGKPGRLLKPYSIEVSLDEQDQRKLNEFKHYTKNATLLRKNDVERLMSVAPKEVAYEVQINDSSNWTGSKWLIVQRFGVEGEHDFKVLKDAIRKKECCHLPLGAVAYELTNRTTNNNSVFCILPLPQTTSLPVHINGRFALDHEARRRIWISTNVDARTQWNLLIMRHVIAHAYVRLVNEYKERMVCQSVTDVKTGDLYAYLKLFPHTVNKCDFFEVVRSFYSIIGRGDIPVLPVVRKYDAQQDVQIAIWHPPRNKGVTGLIFETESDSKVYDQNHLRDTLLKCGLRLLWKPFLSTHNEFKLCNISTRETSPTTILQFFKTLKPNDVRAILNVGNVSNILTYCKQEPKWMVLLEGTPLLMTDASNVYSFTPQNRRYLSAYTSLVTEEHRDRFIHHELVNIIGCQMFKKDRLFRELTINDLASMLPPELKGKQEVVRSPSSEKTKWITTLWKFIHEKTENGNSALLLWSLSEFCLIPAYRMTSRDTPEPILVQLSRAKSVVVVVSSGSIYKLLQDVLKLLGVPFLYDCWGRNEFDYNVNQIMQATVSSFENPKDILTAIEMRDDHFSTASLKEQQCKCLLRYFCDAQKSNILCSPIKQRVKQLPIFYTISGALVRIGYNTAYVIPSNIPAVDMHVLEKSSDIVFLKAQPLPSDCLNVLGIEKIKPEDLYRKHILKCFVQMSDKGRIVHLEFIKNDIFNTRHPYDEEKRKLFIAALNETPFIPSCNGSLSKPSMFFDWKDEFLVAMLDDDQFPPQPFRTMKWHSFLVELGLKRSVTDQQVVGFAHNVARLDSERDYDLKCQKSKMLLEYIMGRQNDQHIGVFSSLKQIPFVQAVHDENWSKLTALCPIHSSERFIQLNGSVLRQDEKTAQLVWSSANILPNYIKLSSSFAHHLGVNVSPAPSLVVQHCSKLCLGILADKTKKHTKAWNSGHILEIMETIYAFLAKTLELLSYSEMEDVQQIPMVVMNESHTFVHPKQIVEDILEQQQMIPYLYKLPPDIASFYKLFNRLGAHKSLNVQVLSDVLNKIKQHAKDTPLSPKEEENAHKAFFALLHFQDDVIRTMEFDKGLFLPIQYNEKQTKMAMAKDCVFIDDQRVYDKIKDRINQPILIKLRGKLFINVREKLTLFPQAQRPKMLTELIHEKLDTKGNIKSHSESHIPIVKDIHERLTCDLFHRALARLIYHVQSEKNAVEKNVFEDIKRKFRTIKVFEAETIKSFYEDQNGSLICEGSGNAKVLVTRGTAPTDPFLQIHIAPDPDKNDIYRELAEEINICWSNIFGDGGHILKLPNLLDLSYSPCDLSSLLDNQRIKHFSEEEQHGVMPGENISSELHFLLERGFYCFEEGEIVGYETHSETDTNSGTRFVFARIIRTIGSKTKYTGHFNKVYLVDIGRGSPMEVRGLQLYKFCRPDLGDLSGEFASEVLPLDAKEAKRNIDKLVKQAWQMSETGRENMIRRQLEYWHPERNTKHKRMCTEIYQYLESVVSEYESKTNTQAMQLSSRSLIDTNARRDSVQRWVFEERYSSPVSWSSSSFPRRPALPNPSPDSARTWYLQALDDYKASVNDIPPNSAFESYVWACHKCHQSAEKALKAIQYAIDTNLKTSTHSLTTIASSVTTVVPILGTLASQLEQHLEGDSIRMRYPDSTGGRRPSECFTRKQAVTARKLAKDILDSARTFLKGQGVSGIPE